MPYKIIAACAGVKRVIGANGKIPWYLPEDFKHFKESTLNSVLVMGRKTYDSLGVSGLARRHIVVLTNNNPYGWDELTQSDPNKPPFRVMIAGDKIIPFLDAHSKDNTVWVCGGESIYKLFLPKCEEAIISEVEGEYEGDTFLPELSQFKKKELMKTYTGFSVYRYN